jgi:enamine deaminase RidA (YjgF/YER057c/UK114 family)
MGFACRCYGSRVSVELRNVSGLASPPGYSHVAIARGTSLVFTAGAVPLDADGELVGADDAVAQTDRVVANLLAALSVAGAEPADVVKTTVYVAGADHDRQAMVWEAVQRSPIAAAPSTLIGVPILGYRGQLVEIEAVAVIDD